MCEIHARAARWTLCTSPPDSTRDLTAAVASGDAAAFERLYRGWFDELVGRLRTVTGQDESFCLDCVQDTMMRVIHAIPVLDSRRALAAWLHKAALSAARDRLRAEARRARREGAARSVARAAREAETLGGDACGPDEESLTRVTRALEELDPEDARLIEARHRFGWTLSRIGEALGIGAGAADGRIRRALAVLRARLEESGD